MRNRVALASIFLIFLTLTVSLVAAGSGLPYPACEQPGNAPNEVNPVSLLSYSSDIMNYIALEDHGNVSALIAEYSMTSLPASLQSIFNNYMSQVGTLDTDIQNISGLMNQISLLLNATDVNDANATITQAGIAIGQTEILLSGVDSTTALMGSSLGASTGVQGAAGLYAYEQLTGADQKVSDLLNYYLSLLDGDNQQLAIMVSEGYGGNATSLTLESNVTQVWIGSTVDLSGALAAQADGAALPGRSVTILMDGKPFESAVTGSDGTYNLSFTMPAVYEENATFEALYMANGTDRGVYSASLSPAVQIDVLYYTADLTLNSPGMANPGALVSLGGNLTFIAPPALNGSGTGSEAGAGRLIQIYLNGTPVASAVAAQDGSFSANFTVSQLEPQGVYPLTASVSPSGVYEGDSVTNSITIDEFPVKVTVSATSAVLMPGTVTVSGKVTSSSTPLGNSTVTVTFMNSSKTVVSADGSYSVSFSVPIALSLGGYQEVSVNVVPPEPWYSAASATARVFELNSVFVVSSAAAAGAAFLLYFKSWRPRKGRKDSAAGDVGERSVIAQAPVASPSLQEGFGHGEYAAAVQMMGAGLAAASRKIIDSYVRAARLVESKTGMRMQKDMTMNEFLQAAAPRVDGAASSLADLTLLAERSLYSSKEPTQKDVAAAERYAASLDEQLGK